MNKLESIAALVKTILENHPETRNSDDLLYLKVCQHFNPSIGMFPFGTVFANLKTYDLPNIKSVERARRKIQAKHPELASDKKVKAARTEEEIKYKAFAREGVV